MASLEELRAARQTKLERLRTLGKETYPAKVVRDFTLGEVVKKFTELEGKSVNLVGRVMALRGQGGLIFIDFTDGTGSLQAMLKRGETPDAEFDLFAETVDLGDFVALTGELFTAKRGEKTILVKSWQMVTKALLPLPEKWHGLQDAEERYRLRYLDLLMNPELRATFERKAKFWDTARAYLKNRDFLEVETPSLELTTGGAEARPFKTHHHDFDLDVYLRISVGELWQKRLMAAGIPRTFEIGRVFRNEGTSPEHLQEFTNLEFYAAYLDFTDGKKLIRDLYLTLAQEVFGKTKFEHKGHNFDLASDWPDLDYVSTIEQMTSMNVLTSSENDLMKKLQELGVEYTGKTRERLADSLWKHCRKQIAGPAFLVNHPKFVAPLSKAKEDNSDLTYTTQIIIAGTEIGRAHAELNDPLDQRARFEAQAKLIERGDEEAMMPDFEFVEMLEHGMPPTFGFGCGERLFATLEGKPIRETQLFPLLRPKN